MKQLRRLITPEAIWEVYQEACDKMGIPTELNSEETLCLYGLYEAKIRTALAESEDLREKISIKICANCPLADACTFRDESADTFCIGFPLMLDQIQALFVEEGALSRKEFLALPIEKRRELLEKQANDPEVIKYYKDIVEEVGE